MDRVTAINEILSGTTLSYDKLDSILRKYEETIKEQERKTILQKVEKVGYNYKGRFIGKEIKQIFIDEIAGIDEIVGIDEIANVEGKDAV